MADADHLAHLHVIRAAQTVAARGRTWLFGGLAGAIKDAICGADVHVERDAVVGVACHAGDVGYVELQVNRAAVQKTCRRLCQVQSPFPSISRQPACR